MWKVRVQVRDGQAFKSVPSGEELANPHHSYIRQPRQVQRRSQTWETLETHEGEEERLLEEEDGKRNKDEEKMLTKLSSEALRPRYELMPEENTLLLRKTVHERVKNDLGTQRITKRFLPWPLHRTNTTANERISGFQQIRSSQASVSSSGPQMQIGEKIPENPHPEAKTHFHAEKEWLEPSHSQRTEDSRPGRLHHFQKSSGYNAQEAIKAERLLEREHLRAMELVYPETSQIPWTNERLLKTKRTRQRRRPLSSETGNATKRSPGLGKVSQSHDYWVSNDTEPGKRGVSDQPHLIVEELVVFAPKDCQNKKLHLHNEQTFSISSNGATSDPRLQTNQTSPTFSNSVKKVQTIIKSEQKKSFNSWIEAKTTSVLRSEWTHQEVKRKPLSDMGRPNAEEPHPQHLPQRCSERATKIIPGILNARDREYDYDEKQEAEKSRQSKEPDENFKSAHKVIPKAVFPTRYLMPNQHDSKISSVEHTLRKRRETKQSRTTKDITVSNAPYDSLESGEDEDARRINGGGCGNVSVFGGEIQDYNSSRDEWGTRRWVRGGRVHLVETVVTLLVKDINDNPPVFPNTTMFGEVQENGPIGEYNLSVCLCLGSRGREGCSPPMSLHVRRDRF